MWARGMVDFNPLDGGAYLGSSLQGASSLAFLSGGENTNNRKVAFHNQKMNFDPVTEQISAEMIIENASVGLSSHQ